MMAMTTSNSASVKARLRDSLMGYTSEKTEERKDKGGLRFSKSGDNNQRQDDHSTQETVFGGKRQSRTSTN
jgi:hypothetical protein